MNFAILTLNVPTQGNVDPVVFCWKILEIMSYFKPWASVIHVYKNAIQNSFMVYVIQSSKNGIKTVCYQWSL